MRDWDDLAAEIEASLKRFKTEPYGDLMATPERVSGIVVHILQTKASPKMQPTFKPSLFDRVKNSGFVQTIKTNWEQNPAAVLLGAAAVITATAKLVDTVSSIPSKRAYAKEATMRAKRKG